MSTDLALNKAAVVRRAQKLRTRLELTTSPADIFGAVERIERIVVRTLPLETKGLRAVSVLAQDPSEPHVILLNSGRTRREQRFDLAHELYHVAYHGRFGQTFECFETPQLLRTPMLEYQANTGAAELLVPMADVLPFLAENRDCFLSAGGLYFLTRSVADHYDITLTTAELRICDLLYELKCYLAGTPITAIVPRAKTQTHVSLSDIAATPPEPDDPRVIDYYFPETPLNWTPGLCWKERPPRMRQKRYIKLR